MSRLGAETRVSTLCRTRKDDDHAITRTKGPVHLEVTGLPPLPLSLEEWERALIEPVLVRAFAALKAAAATNDEELRDGKAN